MCPLCIGAALYLLSGAGSAGGAAALTARGVLRRRNKPKARTANRMTCVPAAAAHARQPADRSSRLSLP